MVARVTRRDVRTVPITLRNRACVWKCVCRAILISDRQFALHICFSARVTRPRVILETATPLFLQKTDRILWIQKRLDEIDRENNQLRIKFVVNNWNNIVDNNIRYRFAPACRKRIDYFISRFFLLFLFIDTSNCLFLWTEKNSFRKKTKKILFGGESRIVKKRWGARWGGKNDCVISTRFGGCNRKGWARRKRWCWLRWRQNSLYEDKQLSQPLRPI